MPELKDVEPLRRRNHQKRSIPPLLMTGDSLPVTRTLYLVRRPPSHYLPTSLTPGTGTTMLATAVAHHTTASFIRVVGSEFVQKYLGEVRPFQRVEGGLPWDRTCVQGPFLVVHASTRTMTRPTNLTPPPGPAHGARRLPPGQGERARHHLH